MTIFWFTLAIFIAAFAALAVGCLRGRALRKRDCDSCPAHPKRTKGSTTC